MLEPRFVVACVLATQVLSSFKWALEDVFGVVCEMMLDMDIRAGLVCPINVTWCRSEAKWS